LLIDVPRGRRLTLRRVRRALRERSRQVVEASESGERLVAKVRLISLALLALIQLAPLLELDSVPARVAFHTQEAVALRGHQWRHLSGKDPLTGLANRAWFEERLEAEMSRADRGGHPLSLAVVDLDSFRELNGAHGHAGGDLALQTIARCLRQSIRKSDLAARLGGDEFVIVFPDTDADQGVLRLDSLRQEVAGLRIQTGRSAFTVTMSVGVASFPGDGSTIPEVLAAADARAFQAKHQGKNQVVGPVPVQVPSLSVV
jgi:diguanylate cyclase (GGDEF)-like protein